MKESQKDKMEHKGNENENNYISVSFFFLSLFLASKQGLDTDIFKAAALFSL